MTSILTKNKKNDEKDILYALRCYGAVQLLSERAG